MWTGMVAVLDACTHAQGGLFDTTTDDLDDDGIDGEDEDEPMGVSR
jgi:hypothetical protein